MIKMANILDGWCQMDAANCFATTMVSVGVRCWIFSVALVRSVQIVKYHDQQLN